MTIDEQRAAFEAWITSPPHDQSVERFPESDAWPNCYKVYQVHLAWDAWQAANEHAQKTP